MKSNNMLNRLIYEYYEARILYGFYVCGDQLPSIQRIGGIFHMAPGTVRAGLALLEKNGYIRIDARKAALVVYEAESSDFRRNAAEYFVPRREGIRDLIQAGTLVVEPLWKAGLRCWSESEWETLRQGLSDPDPGAVSMPVQLYILALGALNNGLVLNFYWEIIRYIRFPYLADREEKARAAKALPCTSEEEIIGFLQQELDRSYATVISDLFAFMDQGEEEYGLEGAEPIGFKWDIYRQRPQLRYTMSSRIIREILNGTYPEGSYLPSLPRMAEQYGVGMNTVRRTLEILSCLGMVRSYHGKGTQVCAEPVDIDLSKQEIREGLRMYRESLQFLALTVRGVTQSALEAASPQDRAELKQCLARLIREKKSYLCIERTQVFIEAQCHSAFIRECYGKVRELLAWGYPLGLLRQRDGSLHREHLGTAKLLVRCLEENRAQDYAAECERLMQVEMERLEREM